MAASLLALEASAGGPQLYSTAAYESPVFAAPDDLFVLAGDGLSKDDIVSYESDELKPHAPSVPSRSTADAGIATIVSAANAPFELTVRLPSIARRGEYHLRVRNPVGEWSVPVSINDARPLWVSPVRVSATRPEGGTARIIKVVGRNLHLGGAPSRVRLTGPTQYVLNEISNAGAESSVGRYVVTAKLPDRLQPGRYRVELMSLPRRWQPVPAASMDVLPEGVPRQYIRPSQQDFGGCRPGDQRDDSACINSAAAAAGRAGADVQLSPGDWDVEVDRIELPRGVSLRGAGAGRTRMIRHEEKISPLGRPAITLLGGNEVSGISFVDTTHFAPGDPQRPMLRLGRLHSTDRVPSARPSEVEDVTIRDNEFVGTYGAVVDGGSPLNRLVIRSNSFRDDGMALQLTGNRYNVHDRFRIMDSVIANNLFVPATYADPAQRQGIMASEIGASTRLDFSGNVADGRPIDASDAARVPSGWRAAFFFMLNDSHEMLLIAGNSITCPGDRAGDGEAIALDNNGNTFGVTEARIAQSSSRDTVRIKGPLTTTQSGRAVDVSSYYRGHWLRIASGPGIGQSRRITGYKILGGGDEVQFTVAPGWDVIPVPGKSTLTISRTYWQVYVVGNEIDQRAPPCRKSNQSRPKGGAIAIWGQISDSAVEGNHQFDTDGILFQQAYGRDEKGCNECRTEVTLPSFLEIRGNQIDGEYDWDSACSISGVWGSYAVAPNSTLDVPPLSIAVSIVANQIRQADSLHGGAIAIRPTWYTGPKNHRQPLISGVLIQHNRISEVRGRDSQPGCGYAAARRRGIELSGRGDVAATVLYKNSCTNVDQGMADGGIGTIVLCDSVIEDSCECHNVQ